MALMDLKSNLSWYGSNGRPNGYQPNADQASTRFVNNEDLTVSAQPRGFDNNGAASNFIPRISKNEFAIDNSTYSTRGTATRKAQLGNGSKFPIGPTGQIYQFDKPRTGFSVISKYGEMYSALTNFGLADTYTVRKPIEAMYNKFKVHDEVHNPYGDPSPPFILRGIQRDDNSDPQRFGKPGFSADVPRGGLSVVQERAKLDVERISKFLARPAGQWWITKQNLLHLMYPNREGVEGTPQSPAWNANSPKVFVVQNLLDQVGLTYTGLHNRKHGQFPYDTPGYLPFPPSPPSNYEQIHKERAVGITQSGKTVSPTDNNRLVLIYRDSIRDKKKGWIAGPTIGEAFSKLTDRLGPTSITFDGTIQETVLRRWSVTTPEPLSEIPTGGRFGEVTSIPFSKIRDREYSHTSPYKPRGLNSSDLGIQLGSDDRTTETPAPYKYRDSILRKWIMLPDSWNAHENDRDELKTPTDDNRSKRTWIQTSVGGQIQTIKPDVRENAYQLLKKAANDRETSGPSKSSIKDFRATFSTKGQVAGPGESFEIDVDTTEGNRSKRAEAMIIRLREEASSGNRFNGTGVTDRAKADSAPQTVQTRNSLSGKFDDERLAEDEYFALGVAAKTRRENKNTDIDFRSNPDNKRFVDYIGTKPDELDTATKRIEHSNFDGYSNPARVVPDRNVATPATPSIGALSLQKYKTMTYGKIKETAKGRQLVYKSPTIVDFRKDGVSYDAGNDKVANSKLVTFKIGDVEFPAYIISLSDSFTAGFTGESDQNRADPRYLYTSFERSIAINFMAVYEKSGDSPWPKLRKLADFSLPGYGSGPWAQAPKVTIGKLYRNVPMILETISFDWDNETPWSVAGKMGRDGINTIDAKDDGLPMYTSVDISLKYLGDVKPKKGGGYAKWGS